MNIEDITFLANNQVVIETTKKAIFWSYGSQIATYDFARGTLQLGLDWDYSPTTLKYLHKFLVNFTRLNMPPKEIRKAIKNKKIKINKNFKVGEKD